MDQAVDHAVRGAARRLTGTVRIGDSRDRESQPEQPARRAAGTPRRCACACACRHSGSLGASSATGSARRCRTAAAIRRTRPWRAGLTSRSDSSSTRLPRRLTSRSVHGSSMLRTAPDCPERLKRRPGRRRAWPSARDRAGRLRRPATPWRSNVVGLLGVALAQRREHRHARALARSAVDVRLTPMKPRPPITSTGAFCLNALTRPPSAPRSARAGARRSGTARAIRSRNRSASTLAHPALVAVHAAGDQAARAARVTTTPA